MPKKIDKAENGQRNNNVAEDLGPNEVSADRKNLFQGYRFGFLNRFSNVMLSHLQAEKICDHRADDKGCHNDHGSFIIGMQGQHCFHNAQALITLVQNEKCIPIRSWLMRISG